MPESLTVALGRESRGETGLQPVKAERAAKGPFKPRLSRWAGVTVGDPWGAARSRGGRGPA